MKLFKFRAADGVVYNVWPNQVFLQTRNHKTYVRSFFGTAYIEIDLTHDEAEDKLHEAMKSELGE